MSQHWGLCHGLFEVLKRLSAVLSPCKWNFLLSKSNERLDYLGEILYEPAIEVSKAYESLNLFEVCWPNPVQDCLNLLRIHTQSFSRYDDTQEDCLRDIKLALLDVYLQASFAESLKNLFDMTLVLLPGLAIDKDVVQVGLAEVVEEVPQGIIDVLLEGARTVSQPKQ